MRSPLRSLLFSLLALLGLAGCAVGGRQRAEEALRRGAYFEAERSFRELYRTTPRAKRSDRAYYAQQAGRAALLGRRATIARQFLGSALRLAPSDSLTAYYLRQVDSLLGPSAGQGQGKLDLEAPTYEVRPFAPLRSARSDYGVTFAPDGRELFFTSHRSRGEGAKRLSPVTGEATGRIYRLSQRPDGAWISLPDSLRGLTPQGREVGTPTLSPDGRTLYYTAIMALPSGQELPQIYRSERTPEGGWSAGEALALFADSLRLTAHPALSPSGQSLIFVSSSAGGTGKDLYCSQRQGTGWSTPLPLGAPVNSPADELFPYAPSDSLLYFASDRPGGAGGLDIYEARLTEAGDYAVRPLPSPLNSPADDYGYYPSPKPATWAPAEELLEGGLLASARDDASGRPHLYEVLRRAVETAIEVEVLDREGFPIAGALVRLVGKTSQRADQVATTDSRGRARLLASPAVDYVMLASASEYLNQYVRLSTDPSQQSEVYSVTFYLASRVKTEALREVYYAFDQAELLPESEPELQKLLDLLKDNPTVRLELSAHADRHGSADYNRRLAERRAASVVRYLQERGIAPERLVARGYGKERPFVVTRGVAAQHPFLSEGALLSEAFIQALPTAEEREQCDQLNRRTEFRVLE